MINNLDTISNICQNCGADLNGNYCSVCGQSNKAAFDRSVFSIISHFFEELFTWDSRFLRSIKYLFLKPGYLTHEYISGRINRYISPLKMFLFTSLVLFFIMIKGDPNQYSGLVTGEEENDFLENFILEQQRLSSKSSELFIENFNNQFNDNITIYIFFIMFLFSILLKIIYISKKYFYSEHIVFTLHFFTFVLWSFLAGVITFELGEIFIYIFLYIVPGIYLLLAIKQVYHKTFIPAIIAAAFMTASYWFLVTIWIIGTILISAYRAA